MSRYGRGVIWFDRLVIAGATVVMTMIAVRTLRDPVGATAPLGIALTSATGVTIVRVGFGGFPLGFAIALFVCLLSNRRLLTGMALMLAVVGGALAARVQGLFLDGATAYNVGLLAPELAMAGLSSLGIVLELRRQSHQVHGAQTVRELYEPMAPFDRRVPQVRGVGDARLPRSNWKLWTPIRRGIRAIARSCIVDFVKPR